MSYAKHIHSYSQKLVDHPYYCGECDQVGFGSSYTCSKSECNLFLHEQCVNPILAIKHPFSTKCVLKFYKSGGPGQNSLCDVCGIKIKGYHYRCSCAFIKRNVHPSCLSYKPTLEAAQGLTLHLMKAATAKCLHCGKKKLSSKVDGWAYGSSCGYYCYHVSCVMKMVNDNWKAKNGLSDPYQTIKESFPSDKYKFQIDETSYTEILSSKGVKMVVGLIYNLITANPIGLVGVAQSFFNL